MKRRAQPLDPIAPPWTDDLGRERQASGTFTDDEGYEHHGMPGMRAFDAHNDFEDKDGKRFFRDRGVDLRARDSRPYRYWTPQNPEPLREAWFRFCSEGQRRWVSGIANQADGWVIARYPPPDLGLAEIPAEIRPDEPVNTGLDCWHSHDKAYERDPDLRAEHVRKRHDSKEPAEEWHCHKAKYVFCPSPKEWQHWYDHDHEQAYASKPERLAAHLKRQHPGEAPAGMHSHYRWAKALDAPENARRIDMHPLAVRFFENDPARVFFGIEGCLKADAMLSRDEAVISVPSVTLWDAPELEAVADMYLAGRRVFIVPDADCEDNPMVMTQALCCRSRLDALGLDAYVAAPPAERDARGKLRWKGIDDFLGADEGHSLDDLVIIRRETDRNAYDIWASQLLADGKGKRGPWRAATLQDRDRLERLALHAGKDGTITKAVRSLAAIMDVDHRRVSETIRRLEERPGLHSVRAIKVVGGGTSTSRGHWRTNRYYDPRLDWDETPLIHIAPEFCADSELPSMTVGDVMNGAGVTPRDLQALRAVSTREAA